MNNSYICGFLVHKIRDNQLILQNVMFSGFFDTIETQKISKDLKN